MNGSTRGCSGILAIWPYRYCYRYRYAILNILYCERKQVFHLSPLYLRSEITQNIVLDSFVGLIFNILAVLSELSLTKYLFGHKCKCVLRENVSRVWPRCSASEYTCTVLQVPVCHIEIPVHVYVHVYVLEYRYGPYYRYCQLGIAIPQSMIHVYAILHCRSTRVPVCSSIVLQQHAMAILTICHIYCNTRVHSSSMLPGYTRVLLQYTCTIHILQYIYPGCYVAIDIAIPTRVIVHVYVHMYYTCTLL